MLQLTLDRTSATPLHRQLEGALRDAIRSGRIGEGERLPSTRELAADLNLSRGVVVEAYCQLTAEGYLEARPGSRTRVVWKQSAALATRATELDPAPLTWDFHPGMPDLSLFPWRQWTRALRGVPASSLGYPDPRGAVPLRNALSEYLARSRAVDAAGDDVLVFAGFTQAFAALCRTLLERGIGTIALEDPGWPVSRLVATSLGLRTIPVPVDAEGLVVDELAHTAQAVVVCPAHHFPTGAVMSPRRRNQLVEWASVGERLIIEDDYNAELRYDRPPVGALQGLARDRVVYGGTASKILAPGVRLGWLVVPDELRADVTTIKTTNDLSAPALEQHVLADLLESGEVERHLRRARRHYSERRKAALATLQRRAPHWSIEGIHAGLHLFVRFDEGRDETRLVLDARSGRVNLFGLSWHFAEPTCAPAGLVLGYGNLTPAAFDAGIERVIAAEAGATGERQRRRVDAA